MATDNVTTPVLPDPSAPGHTVKLMSFPADRKVSVIKVIREITGLGLKEAKELAEAVPAELPKRFTLDGALAARDTLQATGAEALIVGPELEPELVRLMGKCPLPDRATVEHRLTEAASRIYEIKAIVAGARAFVCDMEGGDGSDAFYALGAAGRLLQELACEVSDLVAPSIEEALEVARG